MKKIPTPAYMPNAKVYAYLKDGLQMCTIDSIMIHVCADGTTISYWLKESRHETYTEAQLMPSVHYAKKRLTENANQLQIAIS